MRMKKEYCFLPLIFMAILLQSCMSTSKFEAKTSFTDFRTYLEKDFYMSTQKDMPSGCAPLGYVECVVNSGEDLSGGGKKTSLAGPLKGKWRAATTEDAINAVYEQALEIGANGIIGLNFSYTTNQAGDVDRAIARGLAIKNSMKK